MDYKKQPSFRLNAPQTKQEKLIAELHKTLGECERIFINLNITSCTDEEIFLILRDGSISHACYTVEALTEVLIDKSQVQRFLKECQTIFNCYIERLLEKTKND